MKHIKQISCTQPGYASAKGGNIVKNCTPLKESLFKCEDVNMR